MTYDVDHYYNPTIGRFTSEDPIGLNGGLNLQNFVNNNPINSIDPEGLINQYIGPWDMPKGSISSPQYDVTILDYIGWMINGSINSIINATSGSGKGCPCEKVFWDCMRDYFKPGLTTLLEGASIATGNFSYWLSWQYAAAGNLSVPLRSENFRLLFYFGKNFGPYVAASIVVNGISSCLLEEIECLKKQ